MDLCIILGSDGIATVHSAETAGAAVDEPCAMIGPGETFAGLPYDVWHGHVGKSVDVDALLRQHASSRGANPAGAEPSGTGSELFPPPA